MGLKTKIQKVKAESGGGLKKWFLQAKRNPNRVWQLIFGSFLAVAILLLAFSGYLFIQINRGEIFKVAKPAADSLGTIDREKLAQTLVVINRKALKLKELKSGGTVYIDPSI